MECNEKEFGCLCKNVGGHFPCLFHGLNVKSLTGVFRVPWGAKNFFRRSDFSWILDYLEEKSCEIIRIKNFPVFSYYEKKIVT